MKNSLLLVLALSLFACKNKVEKIKPSIESVSESIYASGTIKSKDQYQAFLMVSGVINKFYVSEGDTVKKGQAILSVSNEAQKLSKENAQLASNFSDFDANREKLADGRNAMELARIKLKNDSMLWVRQQNLWAQQVGSKVELEQKELNYQNSRTAYASSKSKYDDLKRQLDFNSKQGKNNAQISSVIESDYTLKSDIDGVVYSLLKEKGEMVLPQNPLAIIGSKNDFVLNMLVDEYDITRIKLKQQVLVSLDSYKGEVFVAEVSKIFPIMNERSKTFLVEATFIKQPPVLFPNISFEANIVIQTKPSALLIPRSYLQNDSFVTKATGEKVLVRTGLKDYQKIEILSGITEADELIIPVK
ncbi:MAG: RND transporter [Bacteroidetes bacterium B1(2017)]|nr:MAG: RND transporter [Bacteroidetes bacterium B1(2017)]